MSPKVTRNRAQHVRSSMKTIALVPLGALVGVVTGVVARAWMRLITDDPEFTWSGTIFIVAAFTIVGIGHGIAWAARLSRARRPWITTARVVGTVLTLPLFVGAGAIMLPTVAAGSIARWRTDWGWPARAPLALVAAAAPAVVLSDVLGAGPTPARLLGMVLLAATYASIVVSMQSIVAPLDDGWRVPRLAVAVTGSGVLLALLFVAWTTIGIARG